MVKYLGLVFTVLSCMMFPSITYYFGGELALNYGEQGNGFEVTTLANVVQSNVTDAALWGMDQKTTFVFLGGVDVCASVFFLICCMFLIRRQKQFSKDIDIIETTSADYTIIVENLPPDVIYAEEVRDYFFNVMRMNMAEADMINIDNDLYTSNSTIGSNNTGSTRTGPERILEIAEVVIHYRCKDILERAKLIREMNLAVDREKVVARESNSYLHLAKLTKKLR